jgi:hypothetical protein
MEADAIALELERKHVPFFRREENFAGQEFAMPAFPTPGIGSFWIIRVPAGAEKDALAVIRRLPFQPRPGPSTPQHSRPSKWFAWVPVAAIAVIASMFAAFAYSCFVNR